MTKAKYRSRTYQVTVITEAHDEPRAGVIESREPIGGGPGVVELEGEPALIMLGAMREEAPGRIVYEWEEILARPVK